MIRFWNGWRQIRRWCCSRESCVMGNHRRGRVNILWGYAPDKLYHSCLVYGKTSQKIGALVKGEPVYVRVDTFNEVGITEGETQKAR